MDFHDEEFRIDAAFDRIEETILPCIAMALETLLDAAERGGTGSSPQVHADELRQLGRQLEVLTREVECVRPMRPDEDEHRRIKVA